MATVLMDPIYDPPAFWRAEARKVLSGGGDIASLDSLLCLTGPPDVFITGVSEDLRSVTVKSRPPFEASYWRTRMWHCLSVGLKYAAHNSMQAKIIPVGKTTHSVACPGCGGSVPYELPRHIAKAVHDSAVETFQRRFRAAVEALGPAQVMGPTHLHLHPHEDSMLVAWRPLPNDTRITTDTRVDLDNIIKTVGDSLQAAAGRPGLFLNDRIIHQMTVCRVRQPG